MLSNDVISMFANEYLPVAKPIYNKAKQSFPQLNAMEGDGFLQKLVQQIWQGKPVDEVLPAAQQRLEQIVAGQ